ncbi:TfuA-like protein [Microlunatus soli]|uniref:TfuA-like core domain-containing protein n=1 Tax=Microlunatus soli TaxID=630515 RepID=A0A1H1YVC4_9ACTN|nr:TfuA-like protein [Microlunatus soli]SDT25333.1 hypothetical protein SAMN04489812_4803 [Microlunatus soli]
MTGRGDSVVFIGPSLCHDEVRKTFDGTVRPPIGRGDLDQLIGCDPPPQQVGIVDGTFLHRLAVTPKEVLRAIDAGITVFGASSIGALRAAECDRYGMIGVGRIYRLFADGEVVADDEVAITMDPDTLAATSEPLINIRLAIAAAVEAGQVTEIVGSTAVRIAAGLYFPDRSWARVVDDLHRLPALPADEVEAFTAWTRSEQRGDQKSADARLLLQMMAGSDDDRD